MSSRGTTVNLFLFGWWRQTMWLTGLPKITCDLQTCLLDTASEESTAPQTIFTSSLTTKNITDALFLLVSDCVVISPGNSFVYLGVQNCFSNLEPCEKCYVRKWLHSQNSNKVILIACIGRSAFSQCTNCVEVLFKMSSVCSTRKLAKSKNINMCSAEPWWQGPHLSL